MAGRPGSGGPVPKHSSQRRRRNKPAVPISTAAGATEVPVPEPDPTWHPLAGDWFAALALSGQSQFYQPSDWQTARYVAEAMSRSLAADRFSGSLFSSIMSASATLLTTEGDRRRLRLELERHVTDADEDAAVAALDDYRSRLATS